jgi:hypothetical protein
LDPVVGDDDGKSIFELDASSVEPSPSIPTSPGSPSPTTNADGDGLVPSSPPTPTTTAEPVYDSSLAGFQLWMRNWCSSTNHSIIWWDAGSGFFVVRPSWVDVSADPGYRVMFRSPDYPSGVSVGNPMRNIYKDSGGIHMTGMQVAQTYYQVYVKNSPYSRMKLEALGKPLHVWPW